MERVFMIYSDSSDSITEIEPPQKMAPPLIDIDVDDIILNVNKDTVKSAENSCKTNEIPERKKAHKRKFEHTSTKVPESDPCHWTDDMKKFYNDDWGDEESFLVDEIQNKMDKQPYLWQVSQHDLLPKSKKRKYFLKCLNCCEFGHPTYKCNKPLHLPRCHMCGQAGHLGNHCPNSICLNCGNQMRSYVKQCKKCSVELQAKCVRCLLRGHHFINCSDNWRRFHSTTGNITTDIPAEIIYKAASEVWCCNCGKRGHYELDCRSEKPSGFPETSPFVASYDSVFKTGGGTHSLTVSSEFLKNNALSKKIKEDNRSQSKKQHYHNKNGKSPEKFRRFNKRKKKKKNKDINKNKSIGIALDFIPI